MNMKQETLYLNHRQYVATQGWECRHCAMSNSYWDCDNARKTIPCSRHQREDGQDIIWIRKETK